MENTEHPGIPFAGKTWNKRSSLISELQYSDSSCSDPSVLCCHLTPNTKNLKLFFYNLQSVSGETLDEMPAIPLMDDTAVQDHDNTLVCL